MKIIYIKGAIDTQGGTARMIIEKANYISNHLGHEVTIITYNQYQKHAIVYPLEDSVKHINLVIPFISEYSKHFFMRPWIKWMNNRMLYRKLSEVVRDIDPDILIGIAQCQADIVSKIKCRGKKIIECHEAKIFTLSGFGMNLSFLHRLNMSIKKYFYFKSIEKNADIIVTLTEGDKALWKRSKIVEVIPNFSTMRISQFSDCTPKRVISVGRLEWEKGYSRLIYAWKIVSDKHPDWQLDIFGEGEMEGVIRQLIKTNGVKNICIHKFTHDISQEYAKSSICALTSYYEGFSLILLEAQKHGVPCVAFDCPFGPRTIINDAYNGFLVENGDIRSFADRVCRLIENQDLRKQFSQAGIEHAKNFDFRIIIQKWKELFDSLT